MFELGRQRTSQHPNRSLHDPTANAGPSKDSDMRQRTAITAFAKAHGYRIVDEFYDAVVSGADPVTERPGFRAMLDRIAGDGVRVILVESPDRFAGGGVFSEEVRRGRRDQLDLLRRDPAVRESLTHWQG